MASLRRFILLSLLSVFSGLHARPQEYKFQPVPFGEGRTGKTVLSILQDHRGFMWFGTVTGLFRYDGYTFTEYRHDRYNPHSLSDDNIYSLFEDRQGTLWIATNSGGLNRYDRNQDRFVHYRHDPGDSTTLSDDHVLAISDDSRGRLWIGTQGGGLNRLDPGQGTFAHFRHDSLDAGSLSHDDVRHLHVDASDMLWIGTEHGGLNRMDTETGIFKRISLDAHEMPGDDSEKVTALFQDTSGMLWIGTSRGMRRVDAETGRVSRFTDPAHAGGLLDGHVWAAGQDRSGRLWFGADAGLCCHDPSEGTFSYFKHNASDPSSLVYDCVISFYEDRSGVLWFGTWEGGLCKTDPGTARFGHVKPRPGQAGGLNDGRINVIFEDSRSTLWIGTEKGGLNRRSLESKASVPFIHYRHEPGNPNSLGWNTVTALCEDRRGVLWIGTSERGVYTLDAQTGRIAPFPTARFDFNFKNTGALLCDRSGTVWIGTRNGSMLCYRPDEDRARYVGVDSGEMASQGISTLYEGRDGTVWVGTARGLASLNFGGQSPVHRKAVKTAFYSADPSQKSQLTHPNVRSIYEDPDGYLWIGTDSGLNRLSPETGLITHYFKADGLADNSIAGIAGDAAGNLWISTGSGISLFQPASGIFTHFDSRDGLQGNSFRPGAVLTGHDGRLYFGGDNGYNAFFPDQIHNASAPPPVVLTEFRILNQPVTLGQLFEDRPVLDRAIAEAREITLSYKARVISFGFAALDFRSPDKNRYQYRLEGFEEAWTDCGTRRSAYYTNLDGGRYTFSVRAAGKDGVWNRSGASVAVRILPPWWETVWARAAFILSGFAAILAGFMIWRNRERMKSQLALERMEADKLQELDEMKSRFFANISHEFRTPLTLILGTGRRLLSGDGMDTADSQLRMMVRNGERLLNLVNELLDLSRLDARKMTLEARPGNLAALIRTVVSAFESLAVDREIDLVFSAPERPAEICFDAGKMEKVLVNLISNALKFTPEGGRVEVSMTVNTHAEIRVSDTGRGITAGQLPHIFDRFYQAGDAWTKDQPGSGIGLALTRELVRLHHGEITADSVAGEGSVFTVTLPLGDSHLTKAERSDGKMAESHESHIDMHRLPYQNDRHKQALPADKTEGNAPLILIVEDNADMRDYIRSVLGDRFRIEQAADGAAGFDRAAELIPDLIISDVMMPVMDGYELCKKLKTDQRSSHIPVVMLTAKSSGESKMEGLELGADDYLTKPFDAPELNVRVKNLIEQRRLLRERFGLEAVLGGSIPAVSSADQNFLKRAVDIIESRLDDTALDVPWFSEQIGLSRSQLHRKLQAITGQSASEFIRSVRLRRAAALLKEKSASVSEIAWQVGFSNATYFHKCFRAQYGMTPAEYIKSQSA